MFLTFAILSIPLIIIPFVKAIRRNITYWKQEKNELVVVDMTGLEQILDAPIDGKKLVQKQRILSWDFPEIWFLGVSPIMGIFLVVAFYNDIKPFAIEYTNSLFVFILIPYLSYWLSRYGKHRLSVSANIVLGYGMLIGCFLYLALFIHYLAPITIMAGGVFPFLAFPLFAPLPAFLYNLREMKEQRKYLQSQIQAEHSWAKWTQITSRNIITNSIVFLVANCALIQLLVFFGQAPTDLVAAFTNGRDFFFSFNNGTLF